MQDLQILVLAFIFMNPAATRPPPPTTLCAPARNDQCRKASDASRSSLSCTILRRAIASFSRTRLAVLSVISWHGNVCEQRRLDNPIDVVKIRNFYSLWFPGDQSSYLSAVCLLRCLGGSFVARSEGTHLRGTNVPLPATMGGMMPAITQQRPRPNVRNVR